MQCPQHKPIHLRAKWWGRVSVARQGFEIRILKSMMCLVAVAFLCVRPVGVFEWSFVCHLKTMLLVGDCGVADLE